MTEDRTVLRLTDIDKRFPGVHALDRINFDLKAGEVHVLLGENGAGKSTLMKILSGVYQPDSGTMQVGDRQIEGLTPDSAHRLGIGLVHQELSVIPTLSVAENIFLNNLPRNAVGAVRWRKANEMARQAMRSLGVDIDPARDAGAYEVAEQQLIEIAKVLARSPKILLLDEPSSALSDSERSRLFEVVLRLKAQGVGVIYISHHLGEVPLIGDRVTVLRDGRVVGTVPVEEADETTIVRMMVGRTMGEQFPGRQNEIGETVALEVEGLCSDGMLRDVSLSVRKGEIVGVFGLMGAGQGELARILFGMDPMTGGRIVIHGRQARIRCPEDAIAAGMALISRDRRESLVPMLHVGPNISLSWLAGKATFSPLQTRLEREAARHYVRELRIEPPMPDREVMYFSGGNQQKIVLSRWMSSGSDVLIFDEPTRGIDVGAKAEVFTLMRRLASQGAAIIMISSEPPELSGMADRVLIMSAGRIVNELPRDALSHEALLRHAS